MTHEERELQFDEKYLASILQRNPQIIARVKIHPWRWRGLAIWIIVFTVLVFISIRVNRSAISEINRTKADVVSLEQTNCALKQFLLTAEGARLKTAHDDHDASQKAADLAAARGYAKLAKLFPEDGCKHALRGH